MATVTVDVDVDLDEFSNSDLIEELEDRLKYTGWNKIKDSELEDLKKLLKSNGSTGFNTPSLRETLKYEHLMRVFEDYSLEEVQELLPEKFLRIM